jgi:hypothetical protein
MALFAFPLPKRLKLMSDKSTRRFLNAYIEQSGSPLFLASLFTPEFHNSKKVELDVYREDTSVAIAIVDPTTGSRVIAGDSFENNEWEPPAYNEEFVLSGAELYERTVGESPFADVPFLVRARKSFERGIRRAESRVRRAVELQCSQLLSTGVVTCRDANGVALKTVTYGQDSTLRPGASVDWDEASPKIYSDLAGLCAVIRNRGHMRVGKFIVGRLALAALLQDSKIQSLFDNRRMELGMINPTVQHESAVRLGDIRIEGNLVELWTYDATYKDPQTGTETPFIGDWSVVAVGAQADLRLAFGALALPIAPDPRLAALAPGRITGAGGLALDTNVWASPDNRSLHGSAGTRPLAIPATLDGFGCLNAKVT